MARPFSSRPLTPDVVTVWYRPPEILLGCVRYTKSSDIWSSGLILGEFLLLVPLLPGNSELEQLSLIIKFLGPPTDEAWPKMRLLPRYSAQLLFRESGSGDNSGGGGDGNDQALRNRFRGHTKETLNLLEDILQWDPEKRPVARRALDHRWFRSEEPKPKDAAKMPSFQQVKRGQEVDDDAMEVDERTISNKADHDGERSIRYDEDVKSRSVGKKLTYGDVSGGAASVAEKVMKRGTNAQGWGVGGSAGGYLFDFEDYGGYSGQGGRYSKRSRH